MPSRSPRFRVETLEDRLTPAVVATQDATTHALTVTLGAAADTVTVTGTTVAGNDIQIVGTGFTTQTYTGVTDLVVADGGSNTGQAVSFADVGTGTPTGSRIILSGKLTVNAVETVTIRPSNGPLQAASTSISNASIIVVSGNVTTTATAGQVYASPVTVGGVGVTAVTLDAGAAGGVQFTGTVNAFGATSDTLAVNAGGVTAFGGVVGGLIPLIALTTDAGGSTTLAANVTTVGTATAAGDQTYNDAVSLVPATGATALTLAAGNTTSPGSVTFGKTVDGTSAVPVSVVARTNVSFGGNVTFSAAGSALAAQAGASGTGTLTFGAGVTVRADAQTFRAGDGTAGTGTTAAVNLLTNAPQLRNAAGTAAPGAFTLRQDAAILDANLPAAAQFGGTFPRSVALVSDDGALTLNSTAVAGTQTVDLLLSAAQAVTLGTAVNAPTGTVRLRSGAANVTQTAAGTLTANAVGVRAATGIDLSAANAVTTLAAQTTSGDVRFAAGAAVTVGSVAADPRTGLFTAASGAQTGSGAVSLTAAGTSALNLVVAGPLAGTSVAIDGGTGADAVTVNYALGATLANGLTYTGGAGTDLLTLIDSGATAAHTYTVNGTVVRDTAAAINLPGVENLNITGGEAADTFTVTPDANVAVTVAGGGPTTGTGDTLSVALAGTTTPVLATTKSSTGLAGTAAFGNRRTVTFSGMEAVTPSADVSVTATAAATIGSGQTGTITVTVTNAGPAAVTGLALADAFPTGLTATWTAVASAGSSVAAAGGTGNINTTADLAVNGTVTFTIQLAAAAAARGTLTNTFTAGPSTSAFELDSTNNTATTTVTTGPTDLVAVGAGPGGGPVVIALNADGTERFREYAFDPAYTGGVTVATGDVNGDGFEDVVAGSAVGASRVVVLDGRTGNPLASFYAFPGFTGGVNVAVAGGRIVAGAGVGGGPVVAVYSFSNGAVQEVTRFDAFEDSFRGGVQVGGSEQYLVVGAGPGGGPAVKIYNPTSLVQSASFYAFPVGSTDGVAVAVGGTSAAPTVIVGSGLGSTPVAATFNATTQTQLGSFQAFESSFTGGVRVAAGGVVNGQPTTVVAPGGGGSSRVRILASDLSTVRDFFALESAFTGGVYVG